MKHIITSAVLLTALCGTTEIAQAAIQGCYCSRSNNRGCHAKGENWDCEAASPYTAAAVSCHDALLDASTQAARAAGSVCQDEVVFYTSYLSVKNETCTTNVRYSCGPNPLIRAQAKLASSKSRFKSQNTLSFERRASGDCTERTEQLLRRRIISKMRTSANDMCGNGSGRMGFSVQSMEYFDLGDSCAALGTYRSGCTPGALGTFDHNAGNVYPPGEISAGKDVMSCGRKMDGSWECAVDAPGTQRDLHKADLEHLERYNEVARVTTVQDALPGQSVAPRSASPRGPVTITPAPPASEPTPSGFAEVTDRAIAGHNDQVLLGVSKSTCAVRCLATATCRSADYVVSDRRCQLSSENRDTVPGAFGYYADHVYLHRLSGALADFQETSGYAITGYNDSILYGQTKGQCADACRADTQCRSADYVVSARRCQLSRMNRDTVPGAYQAYADHIYLHRLR